MLFIPSKFEKNSIYIACVNYGNICRWCKINAEDEEIYEENKTNFEGEYFKDGSTDLAQI